MTITPAGFELLYEQGPVLVVNKPGGLLTQAVPGIDSLEVRLRAYLREREQRTGNFYLAIVHRLDRPASGAIIAARNVRAAKRLSQQFEARQIEKLYWATVEGTVPDDEGVWEDFMRKIPDQPQAEIVPPDHPDARLARLSYRVIARSRGLTRLAITLETGRMHQIRLQAASRGWPIWGDYQYGAQLPYGPPEEDPRRRWIALHARRLAFQHPMTREPVEVIAPPLICDAAVEDSEVSRLKAEGNLKESR